MTTTRDELTQEFQQLLTDLMSERNMSDNRLSGLAGVADTTIARIRKGHHSPSLDTVEHILGGLGFDVTIEITRR